jgi:hypothetical protein
MMIDDDDSDADDDDLAKRVRNACPLVTVTVL